MADGELIERLVPIVQAIQDIERMDPGSKAVVERILSIAKHAEKTPARIRKKHPSFIWESLSSLAEPGSGASGNAIKNIFPIVKKEFLFELGIPSGTIVYSGKTSHSFAVIIDTELGGRNARLLYLDGTLSSAENDDGSPALYYPPCMVLAFALLEKPQEALVLGVGAGTMINVIEEKFHHIHVDGVDIDSEVMALGSRYFSLKDGPRTSLHVCDARRFVETARKKYDLVVLDAFDGISPLPHLSTKEFAAAVKSAMTPGGVCLVNIIAKCEQGGYLQHAYSTWRSAFKNVIALPLCKEGEIFNIILVATDGETKDFESKSEGMIYRLDYDPAKALTDKRNPIRELSPY
jgi:spermidine synthase